MLINLPSLEFYIHINISIYTCRAAHQLIKKKREVYFPLVIFLHLSLKWFHYFIANACVYMMSKTGIKIKKRHIMEISLITGERANKAAEMEINKLC